MGNMSKTHLHAEPTLPSRDSLEKARKFASVWKGRFINGCEKMELPTFPQVTSVFVAGQVGS